MGPISQLTEGAGNQGPLFTEAENLQVQQVCVPFGGDERAHVHSPPLPPPVIFPTELNRAHEQIWKSE